MTHIFLGFDPGGLLAFGWCALITADNGQDFDIKSGTCSSADEALACAAPAADNQPAAIGINAPMYWSTDADRKADQIIRGIVLSKGGPSSTVSVVNSLPGACLAQGIMVAGLSQERWSDIAITEAHPGALLQSYPDAEDFLSGLSSSNKFNLKVNNDHERNAALGAYTAWAYHQRRAGWQDLRAMEVNIFDPLSGSPPGYWFPTA